MNPSQRKNPVARGAETLTSQLPQARGIGGLYLENPRFPVLFPAPDVLEDWLSASLVQCFGHACLNVGYVA